MQTYIFVYIYMSTSNPYFSTRQATGRFWSESIRSTWARKWPCQLPASGGRVTFLVSTFG